ncbi:MAG: S41 family peptidase [Candidatus Bipolaricaulota bacterium]|nr:MAG: S41 family peptidase [Candidatus Bipolaricaulota bacterium]
MIERVSNRRALLLLLPTLLMIVAFGVGGAQQSPGALCDPLSDVYNLIERYFYRPESVSFDEAVYGALKGLVDHLDDPYSEFLDPTGYQEFQDSLEGEFSGVGIEITIRDDVLTVIAPLVGTPAEAAGVRAGDIILEIDGESTEGITLTQAALKIRGEAGTTVVLTVRHRDDTVEEIPIVRATIVVEALLTELLEEGRVLRLRVLRFDAAIDLDVERALREADLDRLDGIILDLRNNPGGLMGAAISLADLFVDNGVLVTTEDRTGGSRTYAATRDSLEIPNLPLVVLINEGTASASEILAGAIRDNDMGILIGRQSFGKGVFQRVFNFSDGSALKLTTGEYFIPSGASVQDVGLTPDVEVPEEGDPVETAIQWIADHVGVLMPIDIGAETAP